jgi:hypothetical protein
MLGVEVDGIFNDGEGRDELVVQDHAVLLAVFVHSAAIRRPPRPMPADQDSRPLLDVNAARLYRHSA